MAKSNDTTRKQRQKTAKHVPDENGVILHTIKKGDTLAKIQEEYNVTYDNLKGLNRTEFLDTLIPAQNDGHDVNSKIFLIFWSKNPVFMRSIGFDSSVRIPPAALFGESSIYKGSPIFVDLTRFFGCLGMVQKVPIWSIKYHFGTRFLKFF